MSFTLRPAVEADQATIIAIVREGRIYARHLDWPRFIVAESGGAVVGVGQVKEHGDGSRELASIAVRPAFRGQGIATAICQALIARESGVLYLMCLSALEAFYARLGFETVAPDGVSRHFRRMMGLARALGPALETLAGDRLIIMKRERNASP